MQDSDSPKLLRSAFPRASWWVLGLGLLLTTLVFRWAWEEACREDLRRFETAAQGWRQEFETRAEKYEQALSNLTDWFTSNETPSLTEWDNRMRRMNLRVNYPGMLLVTYSPWFSSNGINKKNWKESYPEHWLPPDQWKPYELPILYQKAQHPATQYPIGRSLTQELINEVSVDGSRTDEFNYLFHYKSMGSTGKQIIPIADGADELSGFRLFSLCLRKDLPRDVAFDEIPLTEEELNIYPVDRGSQQQLAALGILVGTICIDPFLESIFGGRQLEIDVDLYAGQVAETNRLSRLNLPALQRKSGQLYLDIELPWYHKRWHIVAIPNALFFKNSQQMRARTIGASGLAITILLFALFRVQERAQSKVELWAVSLETAREELREVHKSRIRLERDLHDGVLQTLYACVLGIRRAERLLTRQPDRIAPLLRDVADEMDAAMTEIRRHLTSRSSEVISPEQLPEMLIGLASAYNRTGQTEVQTTIDPQALSHLNSDQSEQLFHCIREAVANAHKHGAASNIRITICFQDKTIQVRIDDDGRGFNPSTVHTNGCGLSHMAQRSELCGGAFAISSRLGGPTCIHIAIPSHEVHS